VVLHPCSAAPDHPCLKRAGSGLTGFRGRNACVLAHNACVFFWNACVVTSDACIVKADTCIVSSDACIPARDAGDFSRNARIPRRNACIVRPDACVPAHNACVVARDTCIAKADACIVRQYTCIVTSFRGASEWDLNRKGHEWHEGEAGVFRFMHPRELRLLRAAQGQEDSGKLAGFHGSPKHFPCQDPSSYVNACPTTFMPRGSAELFSTIFGAEFTALFQLPS
jgi:hypothetical protein